MVSRVLASLALAGAYTADPGVRYLPLGRHPPNLSAAHERRRERSRHRRSLEDTLDETPLFIGTGTHYVNIYVGTPPQRVSVIVDTGSHYTAFPCTGCGGCGTHTDPYYQIEKSSTSHQVQCGAAGCSCTGGKCTFGQSYTEGSSWNAYKVNDKVWIGFPNEQSNSPLSQFAVDFEFGCQTHETGLFTSQVSNGIMGFANTGQTLVPHMVAAGILQNRIFSMCFAYDGGVLVLGGNDPRLHHEPMKYCPSSTSGNNWFKVAVLGVRVGSESIGSTSSFGSGKGTIVDSGTTDTYLPRSVEGAFKAAFKKAAGFDYRNGQSYHFTDEELNKLPSIYFELDGVTVEMKGNAYMDPVGAGSYKPRVYLDEWSGAVLGANVMQDHEVVFDAQNSRMGWARATCHIPSTQAATANWSGEPILPGDWSRPSGYSSTQGPIPIVYSVGTARADESNGISVALIVLLAMGGFVGAVVSALFMGRRGGMVQTQGGQLSRPSGDFNL